MYEKNHEEKEKKVNNGCSTSSETNKCINNSENNGCSSVSGVSGYTNGSTISGCSNNGINHSFNSGNNINGSNNTNTFGKNSEVYVNFGGIGTEEGSNNIYKKIDIGSEINVGAENVKGVYGGVKLDNTNTSEFGLPAQIKPWTKIKNFLFKEITITPYQRKVLGEVRDFWTQKLEVNIVFTEHQKKVFEEVRDFWCKDIFNIFKRNKNKKNETNL